MSHLWGTTIRVLSLVYRSSEQTNLGSCCKDTGHGDCQVLVSGKIQGIMKGSDQMDLKSNSTAASPTGSVSTKGVFSKSSINQSINILATVCSKWTKHNEWINVPTKEHVMPQYVGACSKGLFSGVLQNTPGNHFYNSDQIKHMFYVHIGSVLI